MSHEHWLISALIFTIICNFIQYFNNQSLRGRIDFHRDLLSKLDMEAPDTATSVWLNDIISGGYKE